MTRPRISAVVRSRVGVFGDYFHPLLSLGDIQAYFVYAEKDKV